MDEQENMTNTAQEAPASMSADTQPVTPTEKRRYTWLAVISLILCVTAWFVATVNGPATIGIGVAAIVSGAFALGSRRPVVRNTAITSIIATSVLILVVGAFILVLRHLLS